MHQQLKNMIEYKKLLVQVVLNPFLESFTINSRNLYKFIILHHYCDNYCNIILNFTKQIIFKKRIITKTFFCNNIVADDEQLARFKQRFDHFSEFFNLLASERGKNNGFNLQFKCNLCLSTKIVKSHSSSPTSNLSRHVDRCHPEMSGKFLTIRECNKMNIPPEYIKK